MEDENERDTHNNNGNNPPLNKRRSFQIKILLFIRSTICKKSGIKWNSSIGNKCALYNRTTSKFPNPKADSNHKMFKERHIKKMKTIVGKGKNSKWYI
jgi:hypothetical protein